MLHLRWRWKRRSFVSGQKGNSRWDFVAKSVQADYLSHSWQIVHLRTLSIERVRFQAGFACPRPPT
jgi:hypothetical protein